MTAEVDGMGEKGTGTDTGELSFALFLFPALFVLDVGFGMAFCLPRRTSGMLSVLTRDSGGTFSGTCFGDLEPMCRWCLFLRGKLCSAFPDPDDELFMFLPPFDLRSLLLPGPGTDATAVDVPADAATVGPDEA